MEPTLTIDPARPRSRIALTACLQPQNAPVRWVATRSSHCSFVVSCRRPSPRMPALFDHEVERAELGAARIDRRNDVLLAANVALEEHRPSAERGCLLGGVAPCL